MKRKLLLLTAILSLASHASAAKPPNIVLIISDDQSWTDYSFMGHEAIETPNIDRLAKQSRLFKRGYVPSSLCCPSLASMITGLYPHQTKITGNEPPMPAGGRNSEQYRKQVQECVSFIDDLPTLPRLLAKPKQKSTPSRMLLLPEPLGPVTTVKPGSRGMDTVPPKDLKLVRLT